MSQRASRVADALRGALAEVIASEVRDPRVKGKGLVGITRVELNVDLSVARVYVSVYGQDAAKAIAGLVAAAGFLRGPVARKLNLARPPELRFFHDDSAVIGRQLRDIVLDDEKHAKETEAQTVVEDDDSEPA